MADSLQVHLFDDPKVEILPESNCCVCLNHGNKNAGVREVSLFPHIHELTVLRARGLIFGVFSLLYLGDTFMIFEGIANKLEF